MLKPSEKKLSLCWMVDEGKKIDRILEEENARRGRGGIDDDRTPSIDQHRN